uniref:Uncharacterized protein n=1 Tax=Branchiostoma floridae TaxID=7739 RepID=C3YWL0_BRAFL|eukprot:XP_002599242.1 hypothetical protein BRAFLDRAFT_64408 [Branchiostoma floridae]
MRKGVRLGGGRRAGGRRARAGGHSRAVRYRIGPGGGTSKINMINLSLSGVCLIIIGTTLTALFASSVGSAVAMVAMGGVTVQPDGTTMHGLTVVGLQQQQNPQLQQMMSALFQQMQDPQVQQQQREMMQDPQFQQMWSSLAQQMQDPQFQQTLSQQQEEIMSNPQFQQMMQQQQQAMMSNPQYQQLMSNLAQQNPQFQQMMSSMGQQRYGPHLL